LAHGRIPRSRNVAAFIRAVLAFNQFYGDHSGGVKNFADNTLFFATHVDDVAPDELK
jgi:hypothetical protein